MAVTVDYSDQATPQYIVDIPRADLTLIQSTPTEIRQLDIEWLRAQLNDIMDNVGGIVYPAIFNNTAPFTVSGVELARVMEILDPYVLEFEDGLYNVNVIGGNSNISDKVVKNQVGVNTANSAGLVQSSEIQFASFEGEVTIDVANGISGTIYPSGTKRQPVDNLADAALIASVRGINVFSVIGDITLDSGTFAGRVFRGQSRTNSTITIEAAADVTSCEFECATVTGVLDGGSRIYECTINSLTYVDGIIERCILNGPFTLSPSSDAHFLECWSGVPGQTTPAIDFGGGGGDLSIRGYSGGIQLQNKTGAGNVSLDFLSGQAIIDATCTNGDIVVRGVAQLTDNSAGATVLDENLVNPGSIRDWARTEAHVAVSYDDTEGSEIISLLTWLARDGIVVTPSSMSLVVKDSAGTTVLSITEAQATLNGSFYTYSGGLALASDSIYTAIIVVADGLGSETAERAIVVT